MFLPFQTTIRCFLCFKSGCWCRALLQFPVLRKRLSRDGWWLLVVPTSCRDIEELNGRPERGNNQFFRNFNAVGARRIPVRGRLLPYRAETSARLLPVPEDLLLKQTLKSPSKSILTQIFHFQLFPPNSIASFRLRRSNLLGPSQVRLVTFFF